MIRSRRHMVICVRQPDDEILTHTEELIPLTELHMVLGLPSSGAEGRASRPCTSG